MAAQYDIKPDSNGWTVYDTITDLPAEVNGYIQVGLSADDTDDLADLLNRLDIISMIYSNRLGASVSRKKV